MKSSSWADAGRCPLPAGVGGSSSAEEACPDAWNAADSFHLAFRFAPQTYYFLAVAPRLPIIGGDASVRLSLRSLPISPPPPAPPAPSAALGAWANPRLVPEGPGGLPYLSDNISVSAFGWFVGGLNAVCCSRCRRPAATN